MPRVRRQGQRQALRRRVLRRMQRILQEEHPTSGGNVRKISRLHSKAELVKETVLGLNEGKQHLQGLGPSTSRLVAIQILGYNH